MSDTSHLPSDSAARGVDVPTMLLAAFLAALIVASGLYGFRNIIADYLNKPAPARIVYVDTEKLFTAQLKQVMNKHPDEPAKGLLESRGFVTKLDKVLQKYTDAGYLVLTKQAILRGIEGRDVTGPVMSALGLSNVDDSLPNVSR